MLGKVINRQEVVRSTTSKYVYTTEFIELERTNFFVACHQHQRYSWGGWRAAGYDCTTYATQDEALAQVKHTAMIWDWDPRACYIKVVHTTEHITKHHRYKVKG